MNASLLTISQLSSLEITSLLSSARRLQSEESPLKPPLPLSGKTIGLLFFENSTRTRLSFESAIRRLGATPLTLAIAQSSVQKGETLLDSAKNLRALGVDAFVLRHPEAGAAEFLAREIAVPVINAGDGMHAHPTQALLDAATLWQSWSALRTPAPAEENCLEGCKVLILGDILHSRVARSNLELLPRLGAQVTVCGPGSLLPSVEQLRAYGSIGRSLFPDESLRECNAVMVLRLQRERQSAGFIPTLQEYTRFWGLTDERLKLLRSDARILHPGPANPGIEISANAMADSRSLILTQVEMGIFVRMAALLRAFGRLDS
ncbi:MAG: aspartate carbamoyltransferase [Pseudomonadota bacterium]|jgi:aspartate carbamoyltransferase catalytic subunit